MKKGIDNNFNYVYNADYNSSEGVAMAKRKEEPKTLSTKQAGELLGYSIPTVIKLIERGLIKGYKKVPGLRSIYVVDAQSVKQFAEKTQGRRIEV